MSESDPARRVRCRLQPPARLLALVSLGLIGAGIWHVDGHLGAIGIAGCLLVIGARWLGHANLRSLAITVDAPHRVTAGTTFPMRITVALSRRWPDARSVACTIRWPGDARTSHQIDFIMAGTAVELTGKVTPRKRAHGSEIRVLLTSAYPFGLFGFETSWSVSHPMCVIPGVRSPRDRPAVGMVLEISDQLGAATGWSVGELRGLRAWSSADRMRQIMWPASVRSFARGEGLVVREMDPPGSLPERCLVVMHSCSGAGVLIHPERFDRALEIATGWIEHLHQIGIRSRFMADFDGWRVRSTHIRSGIIEMRERFARAKRCNSTEIHELQEVLRRNAGSDETLILISDMPPETWRNVVPPRATHTLISNHSPR